MELARRGVLRGALAACAGCGLAACGGGSRGGDRGGGLPAPESKGAPLAKLADVPVGGSLSVQAPDGAKLVLTRTTETAVAGWSARCPHSGCTVAPDGATFTCPCHGSQFDAATGALRRGPAKKDLTAVTVAVSGDAVVLA